MKNISRKPKSPRKKPTRNIEQRRAEKYQTWKQA